MWSIVADDGKQFCDSGRRMLARSDANERLAQPDQKERCDKHQETDDHDADDDDGDFGV